jgi:predicted glycoside hydrolase/deacetylase ChbG (UPF0249 family)
MSKPVITADDFGFSHEVNVAIIETLQRGLVTQASLMPNMPAFEEACELADSAGVRDRLGVHLVLTTGVPLTQSIRSCQRICDAEGRFKYWRSKVGLLRLSGVEQASIGNELRAQVARCRDHGIHPTHLDSHHHIHNRFAVCRIVIAVARELGVPRVRIAHNCRPAAPVAVRTYKWSVNFALRRAALAQTRWFGGAGDYFTLRAADPTQPRLESFEFNVHPIVRDGLLVDGDHPESPHELFRQLAVIRGI